MSGKRGKAKVPERYRQERLARARALKRRKIGSVATRFVCPICGGPHARADHVT
jgi:hypothetical protein